MGVALTRALQRPGPHIGLVVWGESGAGDDLAGDVSDQHQLEALSAALDAPILVDGNALQAPGNARKVSCLSTADGVQGQYAKTRLVMFDEYRIGVS